MVTVAQNRLNLRSAENIVAVEMGLSSPDDNQLSHAQRDLFKRKVSAIIVANPSRFTAATLATAQGILSGAYDPLADASFSATDFVSQTFAPAAAALQSVGEGVLTTANAAKWAIPLGAAGVAVVAFLAFRKKVGA